MYVCRAGTFLEFLLVLRFNGTVKTQYTQHTCISQCPLVPHVKAVSQVIFWHHGMFQLLLCFHYFRQLLTGVDQLKLMSQVLTSIDKISEDTNH